MKKTLFLLLFGAFFGNTAVKAQTSTADPIVLEIGDEKITQSEFMKSFGQANMLTNDATAAEKQKALNEYVDLFVNFRLKIKDAIAEKYIFQELYDSTKTIAKQIAEKDKFYLIGEYTGSAANVIQTGSTNIPRGSVVVTAGGVTLIENVDYQVDYSSGIITILNQNIIDAGTNVNVSLESNTLFSMQRKTVLGLNWKYNFSNELNFGGTFMTLSEKPLTSKVDMGSEPLKNTIWGFNIAWKKESQWLTNMLDRLPMISCTAPSMIDFSAEFAAELEESVVRIIAAFAYAEKIDLERDAFRFCRFVKCKSAIWIPGYRILAFITTMGTT